MEIHRIRDNCLNAFMGNRSRQGVRGESEIEVAELPWPNEPSQLRLQRHLPILAVSDNQTVIHVRLMYCYNTQEQQQAHV